MEIRECIFAKNPSEMARLKLFEVFLALEAGYHEAAQDALDWLSGAWDNVVILYRGQFYLLHTKEDGHAALDLLQPPEDFANVLKPPPGLKKPSKQAD